MLDHNKTDPELGLRVQQYLENMGVETPTVRTVKSDSYKVDYIAQEMESILTTLGLNLNDDSLQDTPKRVAKMMVNELYWGLNPDNFPKCTTVENKMRYDEMVLEKKIKVSTECEHHLRPIQGYAHVAYIPNNQVIGLSKLNRVVDYFARRPQVQERMTEQVFFALQYILETDDVAVVLDAEHFCVKQRGIQDQNSSTITSKLGGRFKTEPELRSEFMTLIKD